MTLQIRTSVLDDPGDINAPFGSQPWAVAVALEIYGSIRDITVDAGHLDAMVGLMRQYEGYRQLQDRRGQYFRSYEAFCVEPVPWGLGYRAADIDRLIGERRSAQVREAAANTTGEVLPEGGDQRSEASRARRSLDDSSSPKTSVIFF
jgi:hypothetical protein